MARLHLDPRGCPLCFLDPDRGVHGISLHHLLPKGAPYHGDDVEANLEFLCGSGTTGHHGLIEAGDAHACALLGSWVKAKRPDFLGYLQGKLRSQDAASAWLERHLYLANAP